MGAGGMNDDIEGALLSVFHTKYSIDTTSGCVIWRGEKQGSGYGVISIKRNKVRHRLLAHRFSFQHVLGVPIPDGFDVCHRCDTRLCVNPLHLFAGTRKQNMEDCVSKSRQGRGTKMPQAVLSEDQVHQIRADTRPHTEIARLFGVGGSSVCNIKNLVEWGWLPVDPGLGIFNAQNGDRIWGENHYCAKLDEDKVLHIRRSGEPIQTLADRYGVAYNTVHSALIGKTWRRIPIAANENDPRRGYLAK